MIPEATKTDMLSNFQIATKRPSETVETADVFKQGLRKPRKVATTFTLAPEAIQMLEKAAEEHRLSRSTIVENLIKTVIGRQKEPV